ncbi:thiamine pyrophosphate enzyme [Cellulomonas algicola]|uniref:Thiamine pyrophosphate enzyme n=1 Tax=Cellulomonas algicola TaxID=2071633 RepID=A0A401UYD3_9CELL|nr:phosphonopyruvate decarboxylase [Cellulomonas algicola]GCD19634.1 thiamine pyrophosphate enzyme [Cellulomonas algicola]
MTTLVDAPAVLEADAFLDVLAARGLGPVVGVPCSFLAPAIRRMEDGADVEYLAAANEGEAVAIAVGARLGGRRPVVVMQNSGLGNAVNPLTSLASTLEVPVLLLVTWRGEPGFPDEPQHRLMGEITPDLLDAMGVRHEILPSDPVVLGERVDDALRHLDATGRPFAFVVRKGTFEKAVPRPPADDDGGAGRPPLRAEVLGAVVDAVGPETVLVATTGYTARELAAGWDRPENLYVVGSMGCASSVALGLATAAPDRRVVVLDGDGAALMRLEALATIGAVQPPNLVHLVLDNGSYESTGGQRTSSAHVDLVGVARACGYGDARSATTPSAVAEAVRGATGTTFVHVPVSPGTDPDLPRPSIQPPDAARRLAAALASEVRP